MARSSTQTLPRSQPRERSRSKTQRAAYRHRVADERGAVISSNYLRHRTVRDGTSEKYLDVLSEVDTFAKENGFGLVTPPALDEAIS